MKKQIKKLTLNKKTISNLSSSEMNRQVGGGNTNGNNATCKPCATVYTCVYCPTGWTCHGKTCGGGCGSW